MVDFSKENVIFVNKRIIMENSKKNQLMLAGGAFCIILVTLFVALDQPYRLSRLALLALPALFYVTMNRLAGQESPKSRVCVVVAASLLFYCAQYQWEEMRVLLLTASALFAGWACLWRKESIGRRCLSVLTLVVTAFLIPTFCIGYIPYTDMESRLAGRYTGYAYSPYGVFRIESKIGVGLRDRYGVILPPEYDRFAILEPSKPYLEISVDGCKGVFDLETHQVVVKPVYDRIERVGKYVFRLWLKDGATYKYLILPEYYAKGTEVEIVSEWIEEGNPEACPYQMEPENKNENEI